MVRGEPTPGNRAVTDAGGPTATGHVAAFARREAALGAVGETVHGRLLQELAALSMLAEVLTGQLGDDGAAAATAAQLDGLVLRAVRSARRLEAHLRPRLRTVDDLADGLSELLADHPAGGPFRRAGGVDGERPGMVLLLALRVVEAALDATAAEGTFVGVTLDAPGVSPELALVLHGLPEARSLDDRLAWLAEVTRELGGDLVGGTGAGGRCLTWSVPFRS